MRWSPEHVRKALARKKSSLQAAPAPAAAPAAPAPAAAPALAMPAYGARTGLLVGEDGQIAS